MAVNRFDQLIDKFEPILKRAFLDAIYAMRGRVDLKQLIAMIERRDIEGALRAVGLDPVSYRVFDRAFLEAFEAGGIEASKALPAFRADDGFKVDFQFNVRNPVAEQFTREHSATMVQDVYADARKGIRQYLTDGLEKGANPKTTALDISGRINPATGKREGGIIGLTSVAEERSRNYAAELASDNPIAALDRPLRDKRFDAAVRRAVATGVPIPAELQQKMVLAYRNRSLCARAELIARSETITAVHVAQDQAMDQAIAAGAVDADAVSFIWRSARDKRVRDAHKHLDGKRAQFGQPFRSDIGLIRFPGRSGRERCKYDRLPLLARSRC